MISKYDINTQMYLQAMFNKKINDITKSDLEKVDVFTFNGLQMEGKNNRSDYSCVNLFPNLKIVCLENMYISNYIMEKIMENKSVISLIIKNSAFYGNFDFSILKRITGIQLISSFIDNYDKLFANLNVKSLIIQNPQDGNVIDIDMITNCNKIELLKLEKCDVSNVDNLDKFTCCEELSLLWSKYLISKNVFKEMKSLKKVYIDSKYNDYFEKTNIILKNNKIDDMFIKDKTL